MYEKEGKNPSNDLPSILHYARLLQERDGNKDSMQKGKKKKQANAHKRNTKKAREGQVSSREEIRKATNGRKGGNAIVLSKAKILLLERESVNEKMLATERGGGRRKC